MQSILCGGNALGRIIARPFVGTNNNCRSMVNRRDYSLTPFEIIVLDKIKNSGGNVIATEKIEDRR
jgi:phosphopentomutase